MIVVYVIHHCAVTIQNSSGEGEEEEEEEADYDDGESDVDPDPLLPPSTGSAASAVVAEDTGSLQVLSHMCMHPCMNTP